MTVVEELARFVVERSWDDLSDAARQRAEDPCSRRARLRARRARRAASPGDPRPARRLRRPSALHADRRRPHRARPRGALQRRARPLPRLQRLLLRAGRDLPSERQPRARARGGRVRGRLRTRAADRARRRLPGAVPALGRGARAGEGVRPHDAGRLRRGGRGGQGAAPRRAGDGERDRDRRHGPERASGDAHRRALAVERACLPVHRLRRRRGGLPRRARHHRPGRGVRGQQGLHGLDRRPRSRSTGSRRTSSASAAPSSSATTPRSTPSRRSRRCSSCARRTPSTRPQVERIELETFQVAYDIIGGGEEGGKKEIRTQGAGRPLAPLPARRRAARRAGAARAVRARADRPAGRAGAPAAGRGAPGGRPVRALPGRACLPAAPPPRRRRRRSRPRSPTTRASSPAR